MSNNPLVRKLIKAAKQRLTSSETLYENNLFIDCVYLGGYAVECALKSLLIARTAESKRKTTREQVFRGKAGHDFENLKARLRKLNVIFPLEMSKHLQIVSSWTTDLRYEVGMGSPKDAEAFLQASTAIVTWIEGQL